MLSQQYAEPLRSNQHSPLLIADKADDHKGTERRVKTKPAEGDLLPVEALVVLGSSQLQNRMVRHRGLDECAAWQLSPAAAPYDLCNEAEHTLIGAETLTKQQ